MASQPQIHKNVNANVHQFEVQSSVEEGPLETTTTFSPQEKPLADDGQDPVIEQDPFHDGDENAKQYRTMKWGFV